ncbi:hypothetical protein [Streptacidiphilus sp. PAMC 29251]
MAERPWYPHQNTTRGHIDPPRWAKSTWEPSDPARRVENREHDRRRREANPVLAPGMLVILNRQPKRIVEIREQPDDLWPEAFEKQWLGCLADHERFHPDKPRLERAAWRDRPVVVVLVADKPRAKEEHWQFPASYRWDVLPEHYSVCRSCGQLPPCDEEIADEAVDRAVGRTEHLMSIQSGCCLGCGEAITSRMTATRFPGPNLWRPDMGDGTAVFHARAGCSTFVYQYRELWQSKGHAPAEQTLPLS